MNQNIHFQYYEWYHRYTWNMLTVYSYKFLHPKYIRNCNNGFCTSDCLLKKTDKVHYQMCNYTFCQKFEHKPCHSHPPDGTQDNIPYSSESQFPNLSYHPFV